jgi:hypothetical protein
MTIKDLTVDFENSKRDALLEEWRWLIGERKLPLLLTASGNAFVEDRDDRTVHFLDVAASCIFPVADSQDEFQRRLSDPAFVSEYFEIPLVTAARERGLLLNSRQIYSFITPLILGGERCAENIEIADQEVHFSVQGQIARQVHNMPAGASIDRVTISAPKSRVWWKPWT